MIVFWMFTSVICARNLRAARADPRRKGSWVCIYRRESGRSHEVALLSAWPLAMVSTLTISFAIFHGITRVERKTIDPAFDRIDELELESARAALSSGGSRRSRLIWPADHVFRGSSHYLLDARGIDGHRRKRATFCRPPPRSNWRTRSNGHYIRAHRSSTTSTGLPPWVCPETDDLDLSALLPPGHRRHCCPLLAGLGGVVSPIRRIATQSRSSVRGISPRGWKAASGRDRSTRAFLQSNGRPVAEP